MTVLDKITECILEEVRLSNIGDTPNIELKAALQRLLADVKDLSAEEVVEKPTAPASLVEELRSMTHKGCDCWHCVRINEAISRYRPTPTEDIVEGIVENAKLVMEALKSHGPSIVPHLLDTDENCGEALREAIRKWEVK